MPNEAFAVPKIGLVLARPDLRLTISRSLRELNVDCRISEDSYEAIDLVRSTAFQMIVIDEGYEMSVAGDGLCSYVASLPMAYRRHSMIALIGSSFQTLNAMQAFSRSVHVVINESDLSHLPAILLKAQTQFELTYKVFDSISLTEDHRKQRKF